MYFGNSPSSLPFASPPPLISSQPENQNSCVQNFVNVSDMNQIEKAHIFLQIISFTMQFQARIS